MAVAFSADRRFRRAQVRPARRRRAGEALRQLVHGVVVIAALAAVVYWLPTALTRTSLLQIDTIAVDGNQHLSSGEVLALVGELQGANILVADLGRQRDRLMTSGWVRDATLRRVLPSTIEVTVDERRPIGLGRFGQQLYLVDVHGTVVDEYGPRFSGFRLPIIDGLAPPGGVGVVVDETRAGLAAALIGELRTRPDLSDRVSQIDVNDPYNAVVLLTDDPTRLHLGEGEFVARLDDYLELAPALHARVPEIDYVDLRFDQRVYVRPTSQAGQAEGLGLRVTTRDVAHRRRP